MQQLNRLATAFCICNKLLNMLTICDTGKVTNNLLPYNSVNCLPEHNMTIQLSIYYKKEYTELNVLNEKYYKHKILEYQHTSKRDYTGV